MKKVTAKTTAELIKAMEKRQPVTVTYVDEKGDETVRTIEIHAVLTSDNGVTLVADCSLRMETRSFKVSRIHAYTIHTRMSFRLNLTQDPQAITPATTMFRAEDDEDAMADVVAHELDRGCNAWELRVQDAPEVFDISKKALKEWAKAA